MKCYRFQKESIKLFRMDRRLFAAAVAGDVVELAHLLDHDPLILHKIPPGCPETPLHVSSLLGHVDFGRELLKFKRAFVHQLNQDGYSPLHLASSEGHEEMVRLLLEFGHTHVEVLCKKKDNDGRIPLHFAAIRGHIDVIGKLLVACPSSSLEVTVQKETVLHLAVKNNQCEAFLFLFGKVNTQLLLNLADSEGNTILHLATARRQLQTIQFLESQPCLQVNAVNSFGLTALDLLHNGPNHTSDFEIGEIIRRAGGQKSLIVRRPTASGLNNNSSSGGNTKIELMKEMSNGILVMASLLATMSCGVALNPPGGYWQDWDLNFNTTLTSNSTAVHKPGHAILYDLAHKRFSWFLFFDIQVFLAALSIILALLSPTPLKLDSLKYLYIRNASFYMVIISIVIIFQAVAFTTKDQFFAAPIYCLFNIIWLVIIQYFALWSEFCKFSV